MHDHYLYLLVDAGCLLFPLLFSFVPHFHFIEHFRFFWLPCLLTAAFFIIWDIAFTYMGVWQFNERYVAGSYFFNLPVEELLFFMCIPYACTFTYYCVNRYLRLERFETIAEPFTWLLVGLLTVGGFVNLPRLYTSVTFLLLALALVMVRRMKVRYLPAFYFSFILVLLPFFVSNGILTGAITPAPVVIYNGSYNLGIRMITIPVEDTFYGMLLMLMNIVGYEWQKTRKGAQ